MRSLTRRELSEYSAEQLAAGNTRVVDELAAYLIETRRVKEARLIVHDIEAALARHGILVAHVASAHPLDKSVKSALTTLLKNTFAARTLHIQETVKPTLLSGIKVYAADHEFNNTARRKLNQLKAIKV